MSKVVYGQEFFAQQVDGSLRSARLYLGHLFARWVPSSVVDIGCGRGAWLAVCAEQGVKRLVGIDGAWISQDMMLDPTIEFRPADLQAEFLPAESYELALSLEVAEHLHPNASDGFIRSLASHSDAIVFSAAFTAQPGENHINTQPHTFWAHKLLSNGYQLFDFFRPEFWSDARVEPWYRQNTFLYVKPRHPLYDILVRDGHHCYEDARFVDCIHPWLYFGALDEIARLQQATHRQAGPAMTPSRVGRNESCPCGSGKKYKHCHGKA